LRSYAQRSFPINYTTLHGIPLQKYNFKDMKPGDIVSTRLGISESSEETEILAVVLEIPDAEQMLVLLPLFKRSAGKREIQIENKDLEAGNLEAVHFVAPNRISTTSATRVAKTSSVLCSAKLAEIRRVLALQHAAEYSRIMHTAQRAGTDSNRAHFIPGVSSVPYAGRVFTEAEVVAGASAMLDFWLTLGKEGDSFEAGLAGFLGVRRSLLCNSGSSANLLAVSALTSPKLGERRLVAGDEVITVAAGFPTTVAPIVQNNLVPVFIDNDPRTGNACVAQLEEAFCPGKTKAVMMAHTLGNPFDLSAVAEFCRRHNLWLIEDNCDALGSQYDHKYTGSFGDLSTQSFYPPHHLTLGEGGAVNIVENMRLKMLVESFRDWGRDCWCASGIDNTCGKRFGWQLGELPAGYDHKFVYSHLGFNLKPLDVQAAIGRVQLEKLPQFIEARKRNWNVLRRGLDDLGEFFSFMLPTHAEDWSDDCFRWDGSGHKTECSWFGFMLNLSADCPFSKVDLARFLEERKIGSRMLFGGNLLRQPVFVNLRKERVGSFRVRSLSAQQSADLASTDIERLLPGADEIMTRALFLGVYPGLSVEQLDYVIKSIFEFVDRY
jgi:CDP-6-deoxy-D-xylo-4-hexulose-3-dehydrase